MCSEGYSSYLLCVSVHAILTVRAIKSIMKDIVMLSVRFAAIVNWLFLKIVLSKVRAFLLTSAGAPIFS